MVTARKDLIFFSRIDEIIGHKHKVGILHLETLFDQENHSLVKDACIRS